MHNNQYSSESDDVNHPSSLYGATKRSNELIAHTYSHLHQLRTTGLRFFTVYGEYGRPDMSIFKFFRNIFENKKNHIFNFGKHQRSFTYVEDVSEAVYKILISKKSNIRQTKKLLPDMTFNNYFSLVNIGNENVIKLLDLTNKIEEITNKKFKNIFLPLQKGDVIEVNLLQKLINAYNFSFKTNIDTGLIKFFKWFKKDKKFILKLKI